MKNNIFVKYGYRQHRGGLNESLATSNYISSNRFNEFIRSGKYTYYGFDNRCNQFLWLDSLSTLWVFIQVEVTNG